MTDYSWREILATHYRHTAPDLVDTRQSYSRHFIYDFRGERYVLSQVRRDARRIPFHFQFTITELLSPHIETVPCAEPPVTNSSGPWVDLGAYHWFVRPYIEHDATPDWRSPRLIEGAARHLARIHEIAQQSPVRLDDLQDDLAPYHWPVDTVLARQDAFTADMTHRRRTRKDVTAVRRRLERLSHEATEIELGLTGITHQDFQTGNVLVRSGAVTAIIDWDRAHEDRYLYDAALGALQLVWCQPESDRFRAVELFMDAYLRAMDVKADAEAVSWMFRYVTTRNLAMSMSPARWRRLLRDVERHWPAGGRRGSNGSATILDLVSHDKVSLDLDAVEGCAPGGSG